MDRSFLKELKNKRTAYEKSFVELKNPKEWNAFVKEVKKKILNNPNELSIDICTDSNIWPKNKNNMPIPPKELYLALQKELMLVCSYSDQKISIFPWKRIRKWKYINRWYLTIILAIIAVLALLFPSALKVGTMLEGISYIILTISTLIIVLLGFQTALGNPFDLDINTRRQFKQLFGKYKRRSDRS